LFWSVDKIFILAGF